MKTRPRTPAVPAERHETIRQELVLILGDRPASARELSAAVRIPERDVYEHLEHLHRGRRHGLELLVTPAECRKCGFVFRKRERLKKPGKCPVCRGEAIQDPLFSIRKK